MELTGDGIAKGVFGTAIEGIGVYGNSHSLARMGKAMTASMVSYVFVQCTEHNKAAKVSQSPATLLVVHIVIQQPIRQYIYMRGQKALHHLSNKHFSAIRIQYSPSYSLP
jgi:hypothetical protein